MKFWDSSALVSLLVQQKRTEQLHAILEKDGVMLVWWGSPVECVSAIARLGREGALTEEEIERAVGNLTAFEDVWNEVLPSQRVCSTAMRLLRMHPLRAADALQLAAAITASNGNPRDLPFVCLDDRLSEAARKEGFSIQPLNT